MGKTVVQTSEDSRGESAASGASQKSMACLGQALLHCSSLPLLSHDLYCCVSLSLRGRPLRKIILCVEVHFVKMLFKTDCSHLETEMTCFPVTLENMLPACKEILNGKEVSVICL